MRFNFKIQRFQTEAVDAVIRVFDGQSKQACTSYPRNLDKFDKSIRQQAK